MDVTQIEYEINVTLECNWDCPYCSMKERIGNPCSNVINLIRKVPSSSTLTISGGEPGLLSLYEIEKIIEVCSARDLILKMNTNGTFVKKYPELLDNFEQVNLHCRTDKPWIDGDFNRVLIATRYNQQELLQYCVQYTQYGCKFDIIPSTHNDGCINEFTCIRLDNALLKYMTKQSLRFYFLRNRYKNVIYLN